MILRFYIHTLATTYSNGVWVKNFFSSEGHHVLKSPLETFSSRDGDCQELEHPLVIPASQKYRQVEAGRYL